MKAKDIVVGGKYQAKVSGKIVTVRVDEIRSQFRPSFGRGSAIGRDRVIYQVTNLATGRKTTFRSAAKFRSEARDPNTAFEGRLKRLAERGAAGLITADEQDRQHDAILTVEQQRRGLPEVERTEP